MLNLRVFFLCLPLAICGLAHAQPQFNITKIVARYTISIEDEKKIHQYAMGWAAALQTTDTYSLFNAQRHLIEPLEPDVSMSPIARSLYGKALKEGFIPLLSPDNKNEMAAVNALQVLSLLGNEQTCGILLNHADTSTEQRPSLRLWASIGLGKSFRSGNLPTRRIISISTLLADFASREPSWYVIAKLFDSLTALQHVPEQDRRQQRKLEELSLQLQTRALIELIDGIDRTTGADERVRSLPFIFSSLRLQLIEPSIDAKARKTAEQNILPALIRFVDYSTSINMPVQKGDVLFAAYNAYGESVGIAGFIIDRILGLSNSDEPVLLELWNAGDRQSIEKRVEVWKQLCQH